MTCHFEFEIYYQVRSDSPDICSYTQFGGENPYKQTHISACPTGRSPNPKPAKLITEPNANPCVARSRGLVTNDNYKINVLGS